MNREQENVPCGTASPAIIAEAGAPPRPAHLTIRDAIASYRAERADVRYPALRGIVNNMIDRNIRTEFKNDSYQDALLLTDVMFSRSMKNIRIVTGSQGDGFLNTLKEPFAAAIARIKSNRGTVKVIMLGQASQCLDELQKEFVGTFEVIRATAASAVKHFTVCDSKMARMEELHGPLSENTPVTEIKATVCFNDPPQAIALEELFDGIWNRLKQLISAQTSAAKAPVPGGG